MVPPVDDTRIEPDTDRTMQPSAPVANKASAAVSGAGNAGEEPAGLALPGGTRLNEFEITGVIGEGGFGIVYAAHDHSLDRDVALKEYMPSALATRTHGTTVSVHSERHRETFQLGLKSFVNEARLLAQFDHPSLVKVYRFWEAHGTAYMVMPVYHGETLKSRFRKASGKPADEAWLRALLSSVLDALEVIHQENVFHRDIAPDNIMLLEEDVPVLLDFGAARRVIGDATQGLTVILKPGYAPIEQYAEVKSMKQGAWTDLYALAATMHFVIAGKAPEPAVARMLSDNLTPLSESGRGRYSAEFLAALDAALRVKPEERPQNVAAFRALLDAAPRSDRTSTANRERSAKKVPGDAAGGAASRAPVLAGGVVLLAVLGAGGYYYVNRSATPDAPLATQTPSKKSDAAESASSPPASTAPAVSDVAPPPAAPAAQAPVPPPTAEAPPAVTPAPVKVEALSPPVQPPAVVAKPAVPPVPAASPDTRQVARVEPNPITPKPPAAKPAAIKPPAPAAAPALGQEAYRQPAPAHDNVQLTAWVAQAQQSLSRREFRRAAGLAENVLAVDPSHSQAQDIRRRARDGEKRAFDEIKIE